MTKRKILSIEERKILLKQNRHKFSPESNYRIDYARKCLNHFGFYFEKEKPLEKCSLKINLKLEKNDLKNQSHVHTFFGQSIIKYYNKALYIFSSGVYDYKKHLFLSLFKKEETKLIDLLLGKQPLLFKKELFEIQSKVDWLINEVKVNSFKVLETKNKKPLRVGWTNNYHKEKVSIPFLLSKNGEFGIKTSSGKDGLIVLDFDTHNLKDEETKKHVSKSYEMLINLLKLPFSGSSISGGKHLYIRCKENIGSTKLVFKGKATKYQFISFGDFLSDGKQVIAPISKGRSLDKSKWWDKKNSNSKKIITFETKKELEKSLAKVGIYLASSVNLSINSNKINKARKVKENFSSLSYSELSIKNVKITSEKEKREHLSCDEEQEQMSREKSNHIRLFYLDKNNLEKSFLIDKSSGWRNKQYEILVNGASLGKRFNLLLQEGQKGEKYRFFKRIEGEF